MRRRSKTGVLALCSVLAAVAVALMFLGGAVPFASIASPVMASLVLLPVYSEAGKKWSALWYVGVALLGLLLAPEKESAILFVFFGYYPVLRKRMGHLPGRALPWAVKLVYLNVTVLVAYGLMLFVFRMDALTEEFAQMQSYLLAALLALANLTFVVYDLLIDRLEIFYHVRLRPKLKF